MEGPLNILLTNSTDIYGGGEFYVLELAKALVRRGHEIRITCRPGNLLREKCEAAGLEVIPLDFPPQGKFPTFIRKLKMILDDKKVRIVHTNGNYDRTAGAFAARLSGALHVTNVHSFHSLQHNLTHWVRNRFATDHYLVDGVCVSDMLQRTDGIAAGRISVVYLGVDPDVMKKSETGRSGIRRELGVRDSEQLIGNVARFVPFKGQVFLIRAFASVAARFPDARLVLVGDGEMKEKLESEVRELGIGGKVLFPGFRDDLNAVYSAFDVYAHPSVEGGGETFPFAVLQALATELPVVVTRVGDVPQMVEEGVNGYVVPDQDPDAIAAKLSVLLAERVRCTAMGIMGRKRLLGRFTVEKMVDAVEEVYSGVLDLSRG